MLLASPACRCCVALWPLCRKAARGWLLLRFAAALRCGAEFPHAAVLLLRCTGALRSGSALMRAVAACCCCVPLLALQSWEYPGNLRIQVLALLCFTPSSSLLPVPAVDPVPAGALVQYIGEAYSPACWRARGGWLAQPLLDGTAAAGSMAAVKLARPGEARAASLLVGRQVRLT